MSASGSLVELQRAVCAMLYIVPEEHETDEELQALLRAGNVQIVDRAESPVPIVEKTSSFYV